jgi:hypothetical protein
VPKPVLVPSMNIVLVPSTDINTSDGGGADRLGRARSAAEVQTVCRADRAASAIQATAGRLGLRPRYRVAAVDAAPQPPDFPAFARGLAAAAASGGRILTDQARLAENAGVLVPQHALCALVINVYPGVLKCSCRRCVLPACGVPGQFDFGKIISHRSSEGCGPNLMSYGSGPRISV